ncbi:transposase [Streptococcus pyogenes]|nr:transposase [Streptococcus pyogenes]
MIKAIFYEHKEHYGSVRITQELCRRGIHVNYKRVGRLLHQLGLYAKGSRYQYKYYNRRREGILYVSVLIDVYSRKIVGWAMG